MEKNKSDEQWVLYILYEYYILYTLNILNILYILYILNILYILYILYILNVLYTTRVLRWRSVVSQKVICPKKVLMLLRLYRNTTLPLYIGTVCALLLNQNVNYI